MVQITEYKGIKKIYFIKILNEIIDIGNLYSDKKKILDYGCGEKQLEKILKKKIINYDINPKLTEIDSIKNSDFNVIILNHVLMYLDKREIISLFDQIKKINPNCEIIIGLGRQNFLSKVAKYITFNFKAHSGTITSYHDQLDIILKKMLVINSKKNIFFMTDLFYLKFKLNN